MLKQRFTLPALWMFAVVVLAVFPLAGCTHMLAGGVDEETNTVAGANPETENHNDLPVNASLTGRLVDAQGNPLAGVEVTAIACDSPSFVYNTLTDEQGDFAMVLFRNGEYGISGSTDAGAFYSVVEYDGNPVNVDLTLSGTGSIKGRLDVEASSNDIELTVVGTNWKAMADNNGNFELDGVPQGVLPVYAKDSDGGMYADVVYVVKVGRYETVFGDPMLAGSVDYVTAKFEAASSSSVLASSSSAKVYSSSATMPTVGMSSSEPMVGDPDYDRDTVVAEPDTAPTNDSGMGGSGASGGVQMPYGADYGILGRFDMDSITGGNTANILGAGALFDSSPALVVEGWVKVNSVAGDAPYQKNIVGVYPQQGDGPGLFTLAVVDGMCNVSGPHFAFFRGDASGRFGCGNVAMNPSAYRLGSWAYLTAVWDFNTGALVLYVDGEAVAWAYSGAAPNRPTTDPVNFGDAALDVSLEQVRMGGRPLRVVDVRYRYNYYGGAR